MIEPKTLIVLEGWPMISITIETSPLHWIIPDPNAEAPNSAGTSTLVEGLQRA
jgi:hypothetical protein